MMNGRKYVLLKKADETEIKLSLESLIKSKCNNPHGKSDFVFLTKDILEILHDDQELVDFYGNIGTKEKFSKQANWKNTTKSGGASMYAAKLLSEKI